MSKKLVDVEDLVSWAAAELSRKRPDNGARRAAFDLPSSDRELVGRWTRPRTFPTISPMFSGAFGDRGGGWGEPPHADALAIEAALERLAASPLSCDLDALDLAAGFGFSLDQAGPLSAALANVANLLLVHGRLRSRPFLSFQEPQAKPRLAASGKPGVWRRECWMEPTFDDHAQASRDVEAPCVAKRKGLYPDGAFGIVDWSPYPQEIMNDRAEYSAWRAGLESLARELCDSLESRVALAPRAAVRPWLGELDGDPVRDVFGPGADRVISGKQAAQLAAERRTGRRRRIAGGGVYAWSTGKPDDGAQEA